MFDSKQHREVSTFIATAFVLMAGTSIACDQAQLTSSDSTPGVKLSTSSGGNIDAVIIHPGEVSESQDVVIKSDVDGGDPPFHYTWYSKHCSGDSSGEYCAQGFYVRAEGFGQDTFVSHFGSNTTRVSYILEVREDHEERVRGADSASTLGPRFPVWPSANENDWKPCASQSDADAGDIQGFPFWEYEWQDDDNTWQPTGRHFMRDPCSGSRIFDPSTEDTLS